MSGFFEKGTQQTNNAAKLRPTLGALEVFSKGEVLICTNSQ